MHVVRLKLNTNPETDYILNKRFAIACHMQNVVIKHAKSLINILNRSSEYQSYLLEYRTLNKKTKLSKDEKKRKLELISLMNNFRLNIGLSKFGLMSYISTNQKLFKHHISSHQAQKIALRVWISVEKYLFGNGKNLHFKRNKDITTIAGQSAKNGVKFDINNYSIDYLGLNIKCSIPQANEYILEALDDDISYCEIERKMFNNGYHYYVIIYLKGDAPKKFNLTYNELNISGIDIGTSTIAVVSDNKCLLEELAPEAKKYNKKIIRLQRKLDNSRKTTNPNKYNSDKTINKANKDKWIYSKSYIKNLRKLKTLYRKKAEYTKQSHEILANKLLKESTNFYIEEMSFKGLQKRANRNKAPEPSEKLSIVKDKNGNVKAVHKYRKKKRFGKSLNNRAPALLITILKRKANLYNGNVVEIKTKAFKASKYNHSTDSYKNYTLKDRNKIIDNELVQRDLYSAFLIKNSNNDLTKPDRDKCLQGFKDFVNMQNNLITQMKQSNISMKHCFGF